MIPACLIPPPYCLRKRLASVIYSRLPTNAEPTGAPSPFEKQTLTESKYLAISTSEICSATAAFQSRAPSRCIFKLFLRAEFSTSASFSNGHTFPPPRLVVFSRQTNFVRG